MSEYNELVCYKQIEIGTYGKLKFFLEKHSTKEGTWGKLLLREGEIDFVFLNGQGHELSRTRIDQYHSHLLIHPAAWHKIISVSESFNATLEFYCVPQRYFNKKYGLSSVHSDLVYIYQTYLNHLQRSSILDVGCGSGRNLLYLANMGHLVRGIDYNQAALSAIQEIAQKERLSRVYTQLCDLNQPINLESERYDMVLSTVTLQFLNPERIPDLLRALQGMTKKGGYHFLVVPIRSELYSLPDFFTYVPQKEELYRFYQDSGWSVLEYKESVGHLHKQDELGLQISGLFCLLLAQKTM
ncbi:SAM-dependent methyltransferase TehB [Legionella parisiensis]|uniref:Putative S-adenosyl-L-methionine-dependent methyltransferase TehB n=1 Tax=Legionella parisiensis TaxID=45071 RepID=A0A1E5JLD1_9GAMM|nr:SAM-dependent methyltransferase TehB [Legionella parisiensis]KTD40632.1 tellurite resistance protein TehB [Legionella parisiensis]OEH45357.1 putative S-adenosyl-L-methionine-dependent methyltransferase TehB [Legionella parisiensis]STX76975.1 tellurite resistance protein TehB [Legionella parisiensis]